MKMNTKTLNWAVIIAAFALSAIVYKDMPQQMPVHWNANNEIDRYADKAFALFFLPGIMLLLTVIQTVYPKADPRRNSYAKFQSSLDAIRLVTSLGLLCILGYTIAIGYGYNFSIAYVIMPFIGIVFMTIGNYMPRFQPNSFVGIKTPYTLSSETVWRKTHQSSAKLFFIGGLLIMANLFTPMPAQLVVFIALIAVVVLASIGLSYYYAKKSAS